MFEDKAKQLLKIDLKFSDEDIEKLEIFENLLLDYNKKYNLISKSTENLIWNRHILDSAQLINHFNISEPSKLADFGSGAGFPGFILAIFNKNPNFHVKLYEKSPVKRAFLKKIKDKLEINVQIAENVDEGEIDANIVVSRAFKKIDKIINISRERIRKPHKIIILKGKNAQAAINNVSLGSNYSYKIKNSITDADSKIIVINVS